MASTEVEKRLQISLAQTLGWQQVLNCKRYNIYRYTVIYCIEMYIYVRIYIYIHIFPYIYTSFTYVATLHPKKNLQISCLQDSTFESHRDLNRCRELRGTASHFQQRKIPFRFTFYYINIMLIYHILYIYIHICVDMLYL